MMSTIATTLEAEPTSRFTLIYGNRRTSTTMFAADLDRWQQQYGDRLRVHHVLSAEPDAELSGRITPDLVRRLVPESSDVAAWFLCGPQQMVDAVQADLGAVGAPGRVLTEVFHVTATTPAPVPTIDITSEVIVALDGVETTFALSSSGTPILDAALQAGIEAPYSCAGGACGTCRAKVLLGKAVMDQNHALDAQQVADGYVLTCQAHPVTEELRIDYDA